MESATQMLLAPGTAAFPPAWPLLAFDKSMRSAASLSVFVSSFSASWPALSSRRGGVLCLLPASLAFSEAWLELSS